LINYFLINQEFYFVDLPGYGFAKVPKAIRSQWLNMMESFLLRCPELRLSCQIVDIRHKPSQGDLDFNRFLKKHETSFLVIANKLDKLKKNQIPQALKLIRKTLELETPPFSYSAANGFGKEILWPAFEAHLK
jgi:GTP-binding protein